MVVQIARVGLKCGNEIIIVKSLINESVKTAQ